MQAPLPDRSDRLRRTAEVLDAISTVYIAGAERLPARNRLFTLHPREMPIFMTLTAATSSMRSPEGFSGDPTRASTDDRGRLCGAAS